MPTEPTSPNPFHAEARQLTASFARFIERAEFECERYEDQPGDDKWVKSPDDPSWAQAFYRMAHRFAEGMREEADEPRKVDAYLFMKGIALGMGNAQRQVPFLIAAARLV